MTLFKKKTVIHTIFPRAQTLNSFLTTKCKIPKKILASNTNEQFLNLLNNSLIYISKKECKHIPKYNAFMSSPAFSFNEV